MTRLVPLLGLSLLLTSCNLSDEQPPVDRSPVGTGCTSPAPGMGYTCQVNMWVPPVLTPDMRTTPDMPSPDMSAPDMSSCQAASDDVLCAGKCGPVDTLDACGTDRALLCSPCSPGERCSESSVCVDESCTPKACAPGFCGMLDDTCGNMLACSCTQGQACVDSMCACLPPDPGLCAAAGLACGALEAMDSCSAPATLSCGMCPAGQLCSSGQCLLAELTAPTPTAQGYFGWSVGLTNTLLLAGEPFLQAPPNGDRIGQAHIFSLGSAGMTSLVQTFADTNNDICERLYCGAEVYLEQDYLVIGGETQADQDEKFTVASYLFSGSSQSWEIASAHRSLRGLTATGFARSLGASEGWLMIGATDDARRGESYFFRTQDNDAQILDAQLREDGDLLGWDVSMFINQAVSGMPGLQQGRGSAQTYVKIGATSQPWNLSQQLFPPANRGGAFGYRVIVRTNRLFVSAVKESVSGLARAGMVHVFEKDSGGIWQHIAELTSPTPVAGEVFGASLAYDGELLVVGAPGALLEDVGSGVSAKGSAYTYRQINGTWTLQSTLRAPSPDPDQWFGTAVALSPTGLAIGAPAAAVNGEARAGRVYIYPRP